MRDSKQHLLFQWVSKIVQIKSNELAASLLSFVFLFTLMAAYFILKPIRDARVSDWTNAELSIVWTATFLLSIVAVSLYSFAVSRVNFRVLVPALYSVFALIFLSFYFVTHNDMQTPLIAKAFNVWMGVFALFHISVFWSFMSDLFNPEQATRLFAFIATGSSFGAITGPSITVLFADHLGLGNLLLVASVLLLIPVPIIIYLENQKRRSILDKEHHLELTELDMIGGSMLSGFKALLHNRYLVSIAAFILLYTSISSFVYFEVKNLLVIYDEETRLKIWAGIDLSVNVLSVLTAWFATSRIIGRFGLGITLALMPALMIFGLLTLSIFPLVSVAVALQGMRRTGNYAVTRPGREMLYTKVSREDRFKAKPVIDIVVYRGGDMLTGWLFTGLTQGLSFGLSAMAAIGALIATVWAGVAYRLGNRFDKLPTTSQANLIDKRIDEISRL